MLNLLLAGAVLLLAQSLLNFDVNIVWTTFGAVLDLKFLDEPADIREHWFAIDAICKLNSILFKPTGGVIGGNWRVHEFAVQLDAIQFWDRFQGAGYAETISSLPIPTGRLTCPSSGSH